MSTISIEDEETAAELAAVAADLSVQAMMFDMDVDIEAVSLVPKRTDNVPIWIKRWREKEKGADRTPQDYEGGEDERR